MGCRARFPPNPDAPNPACSRLRLSRHSVRSDEVVGSLSVVGVLVGKGPPTIGEREGGLASKEEVQYALELLGEAWRTLLDSEKKRNLQPPNFKPPPGWLEPGFRVNTIWRQAPGLSTCGLGFLQGGAKKKLSRAFHGGGGGQNEPPSAATKEAWMGGQTEDGWFQKVGSLRRHSAPAFTDIRRDAASRPTSLPAPDQSALYHRSHVLRGRRSSATKRRSNGKVPPTMRIPSSASALATLPPVLPLTPGPVLLTGPELERIACDRSSDVACVPRLA